MMLQIDDLTKVYGKGESQQVAMSGLTFGVDVNEFVCIVGSSGCGKTTMLRCLAGLMPSTSGVVKLLGKIVTAPPKEMAYVFQDYSRSLLPWMRIEKNVSFPLKYKGRGKEEARKIAQESLAAVGLEGKGKLYPWQLSGGMQQRVAIARALAYRPSMLLMDEPFASVDAQTRSELEDLLLDIWKRFEMTILFVTHDIDEAVYLSQRVLVLHGPAHVAAEIPIDLPYPRDQLETKRLSRFAELRSEIFTAIRRQKGKAEPAGV